MFKTFGKLRYSHNNNCEDRGNPSSCRYKRSTTDEGTTADNNKSNQSPELTFDIHLEDPILSTTHLSVRLKRSKQLLAPNYKLIVQNGARNETDLRVPLPTCLYSGTGQGNKGEEQDRGGKLSGNIAVSKCVGGRMVSL